MSAIQVRQFRRRDWEQLTDLVNAHAAAVVPGLGVSVSALLSDLERRPGEAIVDPWVGERITLVAEQLDRVVAAAHLLRYFADERAGQAYRGTGEIHWLVFWPEAPDGNPCWPDAAEAAGQLITACVGQLDKWQVRRQDAGGELPVRGVYGVPEQWPHISALYELAGFRHTGGTELVYLAALEDLPPAAQPPMAGLTCRRSVGINGTRLAAVLGAEVIGYVEVEVFEEGERRARHGGWADVGNLHVAAPYRRRGVATWLLGQAAAWLRLAQVSRLLSYAAPDESGYRALLAAAGFHELTRTRRGWTRVPRPAS